MQNIFEENRLLPFPPTLPEPNFNRPLGRAAVIDRERWLRLRKLKRRRRGPIVGRIGLLATVSAHLLCGCQVLTYTSPTGERFTRSALGAKLSISRLAVSSDTNGLRKVEMQGYVGDSTQALGIITEAAVRAAIQGAK
jgi:hypothetical protein